MNPNKISFCLLITFLSSGIDAKKLKDNGVQNRLKRELQIPPQEEPFYTSSQEQASQQENFDKETISHRSYLRKPKTFKTLSAYDYVERLRDELKFAEEQLIVQRKEREQNAQIQPTVANQQIPTV